MMWLLPFVGLNDIVQEKHRLYPEGLRFFIGVCLCNSFFLSYILLFFLEEKVILPFVRLYGVFCF